VHRRSDTLAEDAMMAPTARVHGLTVATRAFQRRGLESLRAPSAIGVAAKLPPNG
jgi:hypothetical protein